MSNSIIVQQTSIHHTARLNNKLVAVIIDGSIVKRDDSIAYGVTAPELIEMQSIRVISKSKQVRGKSNFANMQAAIDYINSELHSI